MVRRKKELEKLYSQNNEITLDEKKKIEFNILKYAKKICEENNLTYFLIYGTLIGTVRHKGFIPWDDDIDIALPYDDYIKFINILQNDKQYCIIDPYHNSECYYYFSKLVDPNTIMFEDKLKLINNMGVFIDIFPICNMPKDENKRKKYVKKLYKLLMIDKRHTWTERYYGSTNILKKIIKLILFFPQHIFSILTKNHRKILKMMEDSRKYESDFVAIVPSTCVLDEIIEKDVFETGIMMQFENELFQVPKGWDVWLKSIYGDYMTLPPENERILPHVTKSYYRK